MSQIDDRQTCPTHGEGMVPSGSYELGPIRPRDEGRSSAYTILQCPKPGCDETWTAAPD